MPKFWRRRPEILLCTNIPQPLHGLAPRVILGSGWWNKTRTAAYASTNFRCQACGVEKLKAKFRKHLEGHELYETDYEQGRLVYVETVPLCHACHNFIHDGRMYNMLTRGEMTHSKYSYIINHGNSILFEAGLHRPNRVARDKDIEKRILEGKCAKWEDWRLILFGKEYAPLHANLDEYEKHWGKGIVDTAFSRNSS